MDLEGVTKAMHHASMLLIVSSPETEPPCPAYEDVSKRAEAHNALERSA
jgi:hypothetical protein